MSAPKAPGVDIHHPTDLNLPGEEVQEKENRQKSETAKRPTADDDPKQLGDIEP
jgi:hypothetical protein